MHHELPVYPVQDGLQVVPLPGVLRVEQVQQLQHKVLVNVLLRHLGVRVLAHDVPQQELVHDLKVGPRRLQRGLLLLRVKHFVLDGAPARRQRSKEVVPQHEDDVLVDRLPKLPLASVHVIDQLQQRLPLDLLLPDALGRVVKVKGERHQVQLLDEEDLPLVSRDLPEGWQWLRVRKVGVRLAEHGELGLRRGAHAGALAPIVLVPALISPYAELLLHALQHGCPLATPCLTKLALLNLKKATHEVGLVSRTANRPTREPTPHPAKGIALVATAAPPNSAVLRAPSTDLGRARPV
mmetsp:Transcript_9698/g.33508  ORF Transcript_9698/g.33508 Transcript_9698/m.33508 type:complete len:295 (+) Transcript_9698:2722-3606(+)